MAKKRSTVCKRAILTKAAAPTTVGRLSSESKSHSQTTVCASSVIGRGTKQVAKCSASWMKVTHLCKHAENLSASGDEEMQTIDKDGCNIT